MTYQHDFTLPTELLEQVSSQGLDILPELIRVMINSAMQVERQKYLGVGPYERSPERRAHANGFKPKRVKTRVGEIAFDLPQVREGGFYPDALEKGLRSEQALSGVELIICDAHGGLKAARKAVFGGIPWQRCQFHLQQNASQYVPRRSMKREVAAGIRAIFNAPDRAQAEMLLAKTVQKYEHTASRLADWLEKIIHEGLTVFAFPEEHHLRIRTSNGLEIVSREIRRRTRVVVSSQMTPPACG